MMTAIIHTRTAQHKMCTSVLFLILIFHFVYHYFLLKLPIGNVMFRLPLVYSLFTTCTDLQKFEVSSKLEILSNEIHNGANNRHTATKSPSNSRILLEFKLTLMF